jgi:hypothetical protein
MHLRRPESGTYFEGPRKRRAMNDKTPDRLTEITRDELVARMAERSACRTSVNWDKWLNLPEVKVWQAVALSLGLEPSAVFPTEHAEEWAIALEEQDFRDRLYVAVANLAGQYEDDRGPLPGVGALLVLRQGTYGRADAWISSNAFRSWAAAIGWRLPHQFAPQAAKVGDVLSPTGTDAAPAASDRMSTNDRDRASSPPDANRAVRLVIGPNSRESIAAHVAARSRELYSADTSLTKDKMAAIIATELQGKGYRGEPRKYLAAATVLRLMPSGLTGGRARNGQKSPEK